MCKMLSDGMSMGIIAGVVSGLFYLVVSGLRWAGEVRHYSGEWFTKQLQRHLGSPAVQDGRQRRNEDGTVMDSESAQVREFIERLVETLVSGGLDHVTITRLYAHPDYDCMFESYHERLCETLTRLAFVLQMAIADKPLDEKDTPSVVHAELKQLIYRIVQEAMTLPALDQFNQNGTPNGTSNGTPNGITNGKAIQDDINSKTYEDILATAILNKVIQRFQSYNPGSPQSLVDGNSNLVSVREMDEHHNFVSRIEIGVVGSGGNDDEDSILDSGSFWSESTLTEPLSLTVEESFEEETLVCCSSEEEEERHGEETQGAELDFYLSGLNFIKKHRVPFPELGMDIVDGAESEDEGEEARVESLSPQPTDLLSPVESWEDNWLFQRRRLKTPGSRDPVPMLVPNPSEDFRALIGDRDAEDVSDLSDCNESVVEDWEGHTEDLEDDRMSDTEHDQPTSTNPEISLETPRFVESEELMPPSEPNTEDSPKQYSSSVEHGMSLVEARNTEFTNAMDTDSLSEFGQQDSEYTEDYASVTRRQMNSLKRHQGIKINNYCKPVPQPRMLVNSSDNSIDGSSKKESTYESSSDFSLESSDSMSDLATPSIPITDSTAALTTPSQPITDSTAELTTPPQPITESTTELTTPLRPVTDSTVELTTPTQRDSMSDLATPPRPGTIAEREHRKWENAVPLPNNPYSQENIMRRLRKNSLLDIRTILPEINSESTPNESGDLPLGKDTNITRYGRDYYINASKASPCIRRPVEIVPTPAEVKCERVQEKCGTESERSLVQVGTKVSQWQNEIDHVEESWLRKMKVDKNESNANESALDSKGNDKKAMVTNGVDNKPSIQKAVPRKQNNHQSLLEKENSDLQSHRKQEEISNSLNSNGVHSNTEQIDNLLCKKEIVIIDLPTNTSKTPAVVECAMNGKEAGVSGAPSECSTSSDCEHHIPMPSVKDLAKHFSQNNLVTQPKRTPPSEGSTTREGQQDNSDDGYQPMREVHSLTARSISREFREELKRNLPSQRDRNTHGSDSSLPRSSDVDTSTTPGYTSDETSGPSPTPGNLRNNIAFWEQMQLKK